MKKARRLGTALAIFAIASYGPIASPRAEVRPAAPGSEGVLVLIEVLFDGEAGHVSLRTRDATLESVLDSLAIACGLIVEIHDPPAERVSVEMDAVPLADALERLLAGHAYVLQVFDPGSTHLMEEGRSAVWGHLWVYPSMPAEPGAGGEGPERDASERISPGLSGQVSVSEFRDGEERRERLGIALADLTREDPADRLRAVVDLAAIDGDAARRALEGAALFDESVAVREEAVYALGEIGDDDVLFVLERALGDPAPGVREAAIEAVGDLPADYSLRILSVALDGGDASLREEAVYALGEIGGDEAVAHVRRALEDEDIAVRDAAAEILEDLGSGRSRVD